MPPPAAIPAPSAPLTAAAAAALRETLRQHQQALDANTRATLAGLPQYYGLPELAARWRVGQDAARDLLVRHRAIPADRGPGKRVRVHLDDVLRIDAELRRETAGAI